MPKPEPDVLFVYGTLRPESDSGMAEWLRARALHIGAAHAPGALFMLDGYPGLIPGEAGSVLGNIYRLYDDGDEVLAALDEYEECSARFPAPHEYERRVIIVEAPDGPLQAWAWIYAWPVAGRERIDSGDFLKPGFSNS